MDKKFFDTNEANDFEKLKAFNEAIGIFDEIGQAGYKEHNDATAITTNKLGEVKYWNIELKDRNLNLLEDGRISGATEKGTFFDTTIFIESHKAADLLLDMINGLIPLYINFLSDGHILIFNLSNLKKRPQKTGVMNIKSKGYQKFEIAKREGLFISDAAIYDKNYKLIKKAGEEFEKQ